MKTKHAAKKKRAPRKESVAIDRYISRVPFGFLVALPNAKKGTSTFFGDEKYKTKGRALLAARNHRDKIYRDIRPRYIKKKAQRNSGTKVLGVCIIEQKRTYEKKDGTKSVYKIPMAVGTFIDLDGKPQNKQFSINRLGERAALSAAREFRTQGLEQVRIAAKKQGGAKPRLTA